MTTSYNVQVAYMYLLSLGYYNNTTVLHYNLPPGSIDSSTPEEGFSASAATYISNIYAVAGPGRTSFGHGGNREGYSESFRRQCVAKGSKVSIFH